VAGTVFAEGVAMRATQKLIPGLADTAYSHSDPEWLSGCEARQAAVLEGLRAHLAERGPEAVSRFTVGDGATGMRREAYCGGWLVVGHALAAGTTFAELAHFSGGDADAWVEKTIAEMLNERRQHYGQLFCPFFK
jgi:hypothetical protein